MKYKIVSLENKQGKEVLPNFSPLDKMELELSSIDKLLIVKSKERIQPEKLKQLRDFFRNLQLDKISIQFEVFLALPIDIEFCKLEEIKE